MAGVVNLLVIVVFLNLIAGLLNWQIDLSKNKIHSLSKSSKEIIKNLDDVVNIKVFTSKELPPEFSEKKRNLEQILWQMGRENKSKLQIEFVDVESDKGAEALEKYQIPPLQFSKMESDKFEISSGYFGLVVYFADKQEVLPLISDLSNMEYYLLTAIKKVSSDRLMVIGVNTDHGEAIEELNFLGQVLSSSYEITTVELSSEEGIGEMVDLLLFVGSTVKFEEEDIGKIRDFAEKGGAVLFFVDGVNVLPGLQAEVNESGLNDLLSEWGMKINADLVVDVGSPSLANFRTEAGPLLLSYPYWLGIREDKLSNENPLTAKIEALVMPWTSSIDLSSEEVRALVWSSDESFLTENMTDIVPSEKVNPPEDLSSFPVAAVRTEGVKVGVVADSDFIRDSFLQNNPQNLMLGLNFIDYLSQEEGLFDIRSKDIVSSRIKPMDDKEKTMIKGLNLASPVILLLVFYLIQLQIRKRVNYSYGKKEV